MASVLVAGVTSPYARAADNQDSADDSALFAQLIRIIDQTGTLIPGQGFKSIKLGDSFKKLVSKWGKPKKTDAKNTLTYLLDQHTLIHFTGKKVIETITVQGRTGSLARVNNGIRFGMIQNQVLSRFNIAPDKHKDDLIRYQSAGIEFWFQAGILVEIHVFQPK